MKKGSLIRKIFLTSWFQAAIPSLIILVFLPPFGSRYILNVESVEVIGDQLIYSDLNSDKISEKIVQGKGVPYYYISSYNSNNQIFDQWNFPGIVDPIISKMFTGNFDNDSYEEIYIFTRIEDSLLLNVNELLQPSGTKMENLFITKIGFVNNEVTSFLEPLGFFDENGDGYKEVYFSIATAFTLQPRKIYFYDLVNKCLASSPYSASVCLYPEMCDVDGDNRPEIFGLSSASGNYRRDAEYSDSSAWFMVFDDHLNFRFPPIEFSGFANSIETKSYKSLNERRFILSFWAGGTDTTVMDSQILIYDTYGNLLRNRLTSEYGFTSVIWPIVTDDIESDRIFLLGDRILEINENLKVINDIDLPYNTRYYSYLYDLNTDDKKEIILHFLEEDKVVIYNPNLQELINTELDIPSEKWRFSQNISGDGIEKTFIQAGTFRGFFKLDKNYYYYLFFLSYPGIYFLFYFFILVIKRFNTYQVVEKEGLRQRLLTLQLQGIKSQLDPHFTFNTLNSIASLIYLEDRQTAYDYMNKFTQMLRVMLNDAERLYRSVGEEIEFVTTYLDLEKLRFGNKFNYFIDIRDGVTQKEQVPKLVLQTFAENSIKHGLMPCSDGGVLKITVMREDDYLKLSIEDNGVGRKKTSGTSTSTGKGLKLTGEFYEILNQMNSRPITHTIKDLYDEKGEAAGTIVDIMVPVEPIMK
jgi:two-component sensor histidine kinase